MVDDQFIRLTESQKKDLMSQIHVHALKVPKQRCHALRKVLGEHLFDRPRMKKVELCPDEGDVRLLLLREGLKPTDFVDCRYSPSKGAPESTIQALVDDEKFGIVEHTISIGYDHMSAIEVLKRYMPPGVEIPSSFESIGHIAHLNLKSDALPYKYLIGQVILDKNPKIKTVVNKIGTITSEYRVFEMEVLAGVDETVTEVRQHGMRFRLDFRKVYWNSRLEAEHTRLIRRWVKPREIVVDAMAGIGPFAIPAAKQNAVVYANDLNPDSYTWLVENSNINKVSVHSYCEDGRVFLRKAARGELQATGGGEAAWQPFHHIIMNLPATAIEFLDALNGSFEQGLWGSHDLPLVHVYAFLPATETYDDLQRRIEHHLGGVLDDTPNFHLVRDVAPGKAMICSTFRVPTHIAFPQKGNKKAKLTE